ncbi:serine/threonine protein kinase [Nonomuraea purpurea]|uniref:Serine/threonine protein kinase n=1 Tax=Nonomuraea purpurea TaxID=1849276 RepID=A0ABV8G6N2_9ACTN
MEQEGTSLMEPTGAAPLRPTDLREIGPYRLLGRLGEGGMGTVFLARAPTGRFVALKVVKVEFANQEGFAARFHVEVENARRVASFCTAQVLDNGNTGDGRPYMVTEYIAGTPLSEQIAKYGALEPGPLHGVALGVAAALAAIHVAGLVHRDLKPANVILSLSGPRVIDFGIARALDRETGFTLSGELLGSPGWWAPEQVRGEAVSPAADIFAWGCLVAYAGSGRHPFGRGDPITLANRVLNNPPELGALPAPLDALVRRATSMEAAARPTAQELLIALVGGSVPAQTSAADPPTLVATEMLSEWRPPQNVVDEPDITATFTTPPPSDTTANRSPSRPGPNQSSGGAGPSVPSVPSQPGQASVEELARREEQAAREEFARWEAQARQREQEQAQALAEQKEKTRLDVQGTAQAGAPVPGGGQERLRGQERLPQPGGEQERSQPGALASETQPGTIRQEVLPGEEPETLRGSRTPGTRWLIAGAAAVLAIVVTVAVLIVTSGRNTPTTAAGNPSQAAATTRPNDVGRRFALGANFDDPVAIIAGAPECGLKEYEGKTATQGQLCVIRWTMLNPGGERKLLIQPVVTLLDDRGGEHDPAPVILPPAILPGARVDSAFVFDLPMYRKPMKMTATMLENGKQIEAGL